MTHKELTASILFSIAAIVIAFSYVISIRLALGQPANIPEIHHHQGQTEAIDHFYSTWFKPDKPGESCCNKTDCYDTTIKFENGQLYARRREDGEWLPIPDSKIERNRDNPDGRNHLCAPSPTTIAYGYYSSHEVFCFIMGGGA